MSIGNLYSVSSVLRPQGPHPKHEGAYYDYSALHVLKYFSIKLDILNADKRTLNLGTDGGGLGNVNSEKLLRHIFNENITNL